MNYEQALRIAAEIVHANPIGPYPRGKPDHGRSDRFYVRYERSSRDHVTLEVKMCLVPGERPMCFKLEVGTSCAASYRDLNETREFMKLLTEVVDLGAKVTAALAPYETFSVEV